MENKDNCPEAVLDRVLEKAGVLPPKTNEEWKVQVRDWWYSIQDEAAQAEWGVPEKYRVEIETIIKTLITTKDKQREEAVAEALKELWEMGSTYQTMDTRSAVFHYVRKHQLTFTIDTK